MADVDVTNGDEADRRALELIKQSGVLNPNMTLDKVLELTQKINEVHNKFKKPGSVTAKHTDTFIHSHFIYKHEE